MNSPFFKQLQNRREILIGECSRSTMATDDELDNPASLTKERLAEIIKNENDAALLTQLEALIKLYLALK